MDFVPCFFHSMLWQSFLKIIYFYLQERPPMCLAFSVFLDYLLRVDLHKSTWTDDMASLLPIDKSRFKNCMF